MRIPHLFAIALAGILASSSLLADAPDTDAMFNHELRRLHADETVKLRDVLAGQPLLLVNTASRCGFTGQFEGLEALHQEFAESGLGNH
ncbi:hypothetical protein M0534_12090 [Methylonatrum kenyense]|uniref:hypothetical protein n=1 Tax=Methylonatrum kenyense TaxID=455253 RepID=UPI0020BFEAF9|nr:hypothetical protein [Methylonatrum kenyense]MCK8517060.1 hypothetical protein [Methylonatrum kenyense]